MNILTDILSLFKRKKYVKDAKANDVLIIGINDEPDIEGIASPKPYKDVKLITVEDFIGTSSQEFINLPIGGSEAGVFKDKTTDTITGETFINLRRLKSLSLDLDIQENGDYIEFDLDTSGNVNSVTGLDTDNTDPQNPIVKISIDSGLEGEGTPTNPLKSTVISGDTLLVSGGASYTGTGLDFDISILVFKIGGIEYTTPSETIITLNPGDPTFARFDAIIATLDINDDPIVDVVEGTPSINPVTPALNEDQVLVQYVDIQAGSTTPKITIVQVYREDQTSDWLGSVFGGYGNAANFSSTTPTPTEGSFCCLNTIGRWGSQRGTRFEAPIPVDRSEYLQLSFKIYLVDDFVANYVKYIGIFGYSALPPAQGGTGAYLGLIQAQSYIDLSLTGQWQLVTIPTGLFTQNLGVNEIGYLNFSVYNCPPNLTKCGGTVIVDTDGNPITLQYAIDDVKLQTGSLPNPQTPTIDILENSTPIGSTRTLDFIGGDNIQLEVTEDIVNESISVNYSLPNAYFSDVNGRNVVEVTQQSDFGILGALLPDTTYVVRGEVTLISTLQISNADGVEVIGLGRDTDCLRMASPLTTMFDITDSNVIFKDLKFKGTSPNCRIIEASNISAGLYNDGRLKTLIFNDCQFRDCYDLMDIKGFDLVDINNCLIWYCQAQNFGLRFEDTSKLQITSCELIRWFDESSIPTPGGWATVPMIELLPNNVVGFGAVNINGCVIHPLQTQTGITISALSTTGFGTISSNAFVPGPFSGAGAVFEPNTLGFPDYNQVETYGYDIFANQGLLNSTSGILMTMQSNITPTTFAALNTPVLIDVNNLNQQTERVRWSGSSGGQATYLGTKTVYASIHATINYEKVGGGTIPYAFSIFKDGSKLAPSEIQTDATAATGVLTMSYGTLIEAGTFLNFYVEQKSGGLSDIIIKDWQIVIRE